MSAFSHVSPLLAETQYLVEPNLRLPILLGAVVLSVVIAYQWAKSMRMPDAGWKLALVLGSMTWGVVGTAVYWPPKLGIDLSGGVILVYEIEQPKIDLNEIHENVQSELGANKIENFTVTEDSAENLVRIKLPDSTEKDRKEVETLAKGLGGERYRLEAVTSTGPDAVHTLTFHVLPPKEKDVQMSEMVKAISRRVNPTGTKEIVIRGYGKRQMEIIVPEIDKNEVERIKQNISTAGNLEFRVAASGLTDKDIIAAADKTRGDRVEMEGKEVARWIPMDERAMRDRGDDKSKITYEGVVAKNRGLHLRMRGVDDKGNPIVEALLLTSKENASVTSQIEGGLLSGANKGFGDKLNSWAVHFNFKPKAANRFYDLTSKNLPDGKQPDDSPYKYRFLSIVLDGRLMTAPTINSAIRESGQITGNFSEDDVSWLVSVLNAGSLPASLNKKPISEQQISAQLGADTVKKGAYAMAFSVIAILIFMISYYRLAGFIACWAMLVNLAMTVYLMIAMQAAFTLPGLAGLVLGVAMCVDANVLIYERIREERERGAGLRMAIRNGFHRSTPTIVDSHVTTLITAVILYWVGTEQIRGFAVTLIIGLILNMYTALFCSHVFFDVGEKRNWFSDLKMHHLFGNTTIDFMKLQRICIPISIILITAGIVGTYMRGRSLLDIDFNGGTSVQIVLTKEGAMDISEVRRLAEEAMPEKSVAVSSVQIEGEVANRHFKIDSAEEKIDDVRDKLSAPKAFGNKLQHYDMDYGKIKLIEAAPTKTGPRINSDKAKPDAEKTDSKKQSRVDYPSATRLAMSVGSPLQALAYYDKDDVKKDDANKDEGKTDESKKDEATAKDDPKASDKKADDKKPADDSADKKPADDKKVEDKKADDKKADDKKDELAPKPPVAPDEPKKPVTGEATAGDEDSEFVGGSEVELHFPDKINYDVLKDLLDKSLAKGYSSNLPGYRLSNKEFSAGSKQTYADWTLKITLPPDEAKPVLDSLKSALEERPIFLSATEIGAKVAGDTESQAIWAVLVSMFFIVIYIWIRFQNVVFGLGAVVALIHDVIIPVGIMAWCGWLAKVPFFEHYLGIQPFQISLPVMAAILTLMGYSLNDTIVVFDRIREVRGKSPNITAETVNVSINQTLSRTVLTSFTVFLVVLILYIWGGEGVHAFAFAMLIGVVTGTYSSIYIAAPILVSLFRPEQTPAQRRQAQAAREVKPKMT